MLNSPILGTLQAECGREATSCRMYQHSICTGWRAGVRCDGPRATALIPRIYRVSGMKGIYRNVLRNLFALLEQPLFALLISTGDLLPSEAQEAPVNLRIDD